MYVASASNNPNAVFRFTPEGVLSTFATGGPGQLFNGPIGVAVDHENRILVSSFNDKSPIAKYSPSGQGVPFGAPPIFSGSGALAIDSADNTYQANLFGGIDKITPAGVRSVFVNFVTNGPRALAFDKQDNLYVAAGNAILKYAPNASHTTFATLPNLSPYGLAFDSAGDLFVCYNNSATIDKISPSAVRTLFAGTGAADAFGIAFDENGYLFAVRTDGAVLRFATDGTSSLFGTLPPSSGLVPIGIAIAVPEPSSIALAAFGFIGLMVSSWRRQQ